MPCTLQATLIRYRILMRLLPVWFSSDLVRGFSWSLSSVLSCPCLFISIQPLLYLMFIIAWLFGNNKPILNILHYIFRYINFKLNKVPLNMAYSAMGDWRGRYRQVIYMGYFDHKGM